MYEIGQTFTEEPSADVFEWCEANDAHIWEVLDGDATVWRIFENYHIEDEITLEKLDAQHDEYVIETDAALFDLDAAQSGYEADTDAALFDLVDYISSLEARIEELEASNG